MHQGSQASAVRFLLGLLLLLSVCSCITNKSTTYLQTDPKLPQYEPTEYQYYRILKNDLLLVRLLSIHEEASEIFNLSGTNGGSANNSTYNGYRVYEDGTIDLPYVNNIPVAGLTIREACRVVEDSLRRYVPDAMVKMALANDYFYIVGEGKSGSYRLYKDKMNIFQALSLSGNFANNSDLKHVRVIRPRPEGGQPIIKDFDMRTRSIIGSEYYYIQPNDVIYVGSIKGNFFKIDNYSSAVGTLSTSLNFLVTVLNLGLFW